MIVAVWGRDGCGKSTIADALANKLAQGDDLAAVIDSDLTMPTVHIRKPIRDVKEEDRFGSIGRAIAGVGMLEARSYLHQHYRNQGLFVAGLTAKDDFLSYELGLSSKDMAERFVTSCSEVVEHIVLDLSGQRTDPFLPVALAKADAFIVVLTPEPQSIWWWWSVVQFLSTTVGMEKVIPIMNMVQKHHDIDSAIKGTALEGTLDKSPYLPWCREINMVRCSGELPCQATVSVAGRRWNRCIKEIVGELTKRGSAAV
jgi:MinD-like ATPase involved in chromosome partitioning or flagellar assembly